jgi:hypothetical protein
MALQKLMCMQLMTKHFRLAHKPSRSLDLGNNLSMYPQDFVVCLLFHCIFMMMPQNPVYSTRVSSSSHNFERFLSKDHHRSPLSSDTAHGVQW